MSPGAEGKQVNASKTCHITTDLSLVDGVPANVLLSQRPLTNYIMGLLHTQPVGNEIDQVVRGFGHIGEGYRGKFPWLRTRLAQNTNV